MGEMVNVLILAFLVGGPIGAIVGAYLIYLWWDEYRWAHFLDTIGGIFENRLTRAFFNTFIGRRVAAWAIRGYIRGEKYGRAENLAVSEGLVDETIVMMEEEGRLREGGHLARRMHRDVEASHLYRQFIDLCLEKDKKVLAAEVAEEAGFWDEAINLLRSFEGRESRRRAAKLAAEHGLPDLAIELFLNEEALLDAMRVAEENGLIEFVIEYCGKSDNPVLHHFGADAARRSGDPERGVELLLKADLLHGAAQLARSAGLEDRAKEIIAVIRERRMANRTPMPKQTGPFGFDFSDDILEEE